MWRRTAAGPLVLSRRDSGNDTSGRRPIAEAESRDADDPSGRQPDGAPTSGTASTVRLVLELMAWPSRQLVPASHLLEPEADVMSAEISRYRANNLLERPFLRRRRRQLYRQRNYRRHLCWVLPCEVIVRRVWSQSRKRARSHRSAARVDPLVNGKPSPGKRPWRDIGGRWLRRGNQVSLGRRPVSSFAKTRVRAAPAAPRQAAGLLKRCIVSTAMQSREYRDARYR